MINFLKDLLCILVIILSFIKSVGFDEKIIIRPQEELYWNTPYYSQIPEMPNGCEATSIAMVLNYYGFLCTKEKVFEDYMPHSDAYFYNQNGELCGPNPNKYYCGSPYTTSGLGMQCFEEVWVKTLENAIKKEGVKKKVIKPNIDCVDDMEYYLNYAPLVVGITCDLKPPKVWMEYKDMETGENVVIFYNFHCVVVVGYDRDYFLIRDPLGAYEKIEKELFLRVFMSVGSQCATIV